MPPEDAQDRSGSSAQDASSIELNFRAILVVDVVDSVALYERIGDVRAKKMVLGCLDALARIVRLRYGQVIKSLGDGLLCSFDAKENPVLAALAMSEEAGNHNLAVHIGMHWGEVVEDGEDVFGTAVNTTSRIAALAKPSEVLISREMVAALPPFIQSMIRPVQPIAVKGRRDPLELFTLLKGDLSQTLSPVDFNPARMPPDAGLEVSYKDKTWHLEAGSELTIGRDADCDVVLIGTHTSRLHAKIVHRQGKFFLVDFSANGTYVAPSDEVPLQFLREEALLHGSGQIHPGAHPDKIPTPPICYSRATGKPRG